MRSISIELIDKVAQQLCIKNGSDLEARVGCGALDDMTIAERMEYMKGRSGVPLIGRTIPIWRIYRPRAEQLIIEYLVMQEMGGLIDEEVKQEARSEAQCKGSETTS